MLPKDAKENGYLLKLPEKQKAVKEAPMFRVLEFQRKPVHKKLPLPSWIGKHPCPSEEIVYNTSTPGGINRPTKREVNLRMELRRGIKNAETFEKIIKVFAVRARQEHRWLDMQRREWLSRAKRWANEMVLQDLTPTETTFKMVLLGCAANGDSQGVLYWLKRMQKAGHKTGRLEYNAVIGTFAKDGLPHKVEEWMARMLKEGGFKPDARTWASKIQGWEVVGNRQGMLQAMLEFQEAESSGELGQPVDPMDSAAPYYELARTYVKVADAPRAMAVLKVAQDKKLPLSREVHRLRLDVHLNTPAPRRSLGEIERALHDLIDNRPPKGPLFLPSTDKKLREVLGDKHYQEIVNSHFITAKELVADVPDEQTIKNWRKGQIQEATIFKYINGRAFLRKPREDTMFYKFKKHVRADAKALKKAIARTEKGLPEWMTMKEPERYAMDDYKEWARQENVS